MSNSFQIASRRWNTRCEAECIDETLKIGLWAPSHFHTRHRRLTLAVTRIMLNAMWVGCESPDGLRLEGGVRLQVRQRSVHGDKERGVFTRLSSHVCGRVADMK
jgi:hypothetical protein